jgi:NAD(P)-dependent dehydrogenase (short-subunit alcohol dehydrogenase family)
MDSSPFDLRGKVAIVTGGNGGIGLGMARGLANAGTAIAVVGRNEAKSAAVGRRQVLTDALARKNKSPGPLPGAFVWSAADEAQYRATTGAPNL